MCGIVGYIGEKNASDVLIGGLEKLEYRGYDSSGIAVCQNNTISVKKFQGRLSVLESYLQSNPVEGCCGIGHTRWATHGAPSDKNSHPHSSDDGLISLVHNGIIENYQELKSMLSEKGYQFRSDTDTEVVAHLIRDCYHGSFLNAVTDAVGQLKGAYALAIVCAAEPDRLIAVRKDSPLIIGLGQNENFIASDIPAILEYTRDVYLIDNGTVAVLSSQNVQLFDEQQQPIHKDIFHVTWDADAATKAGYPHFMLKEIFEQPNAIENTLRGRINSDQKEITLDKFNLSKQDFDKIDKIWIVACGTAYYAGCIGKYLIEKYARKPVEMQIASEFRYANPIIGNRTLFIAISQSGETADTLACMRLAKEKGARILAVSNVVGSSVTREADDVLYTWAGPEIAVASTKAYSTQVICMMLAALKMGQLSGELADDGADRIFQTLPQLAQHASSALEMSGFVSELSKKITGLSSIFYIGRGLDYYLALEGALKMKEISYVHAEAYPAGELKHGPIALLEKGSVVVALCTQSGEYLEKIISNIEEIKARGAFVVAIAQKKCKKVQYVADDIIWIDDIEDDAAIIPAVIILQLLAYFTSINKGCDVDKPRNLAKSVTVE
ncbi:MAG: glutamine--fructose-6-phosphate transaminase (isomerizing) [Anaerofustis sp.]